MALDRSRIQGFGSDGSTTKVWRCPDGHVMRPWAAEPGICDGCQRHVSKGERVMDCRQCNWYLCGSCHLQDTRGDSSFWGAVTELIAAAAQDMSEVAAGIGALVSGMSCQPSSDFFSATEVEILTHNVSSSTGVVESLKSCQQKSPQQKSPQQKSPRQKSPRAAAERVLRVSFSDDLLGGADSAAVGRRGGPAPALAPPATTTVPGEAGPPFTDNLLDLTHPVPEAAVPAGAGFAGAGAFGHEGDLDPLAVGAPPEAALLAHGAVASSSAMGCTGDIKPLPAGKLAEEAAAPMDPGASILHAARGGA